MQLQRPAAVESGSRRRGASQPQYAACCTSTCEEQRSNTQELQKEESKKGAESQAERRARRKRRTSSRAPTRGGAGLQGRRGAVGLAQSATVDRVHSNSPCGKRARERVGAERESWSTSLTATLAPADRSYAGERVETSMKRAYNSSASASASASANPYANASYTSAPPLPPGPPPPPPQQQPGQHGQQAYPYAATYGAPPQPAAAVMAAHPQYPGYGYGSVSSAHPRTVLKVERID